MEYYPKKTLNLLAGIIIFILLLLLSGLFVRKLTSFLEEAYYLEPGIQVNKIPRIQNP